jgi:hypothetical protein
LWSVGLVWLTMPGTSKSGPRAAMVSPAVICVRTVPPHRPIPCLITGASADRPDVRLLSPSRVHATAFAPGRLG